MLVFCGHYIVADRLAHPGTFRLKLITAILSLGLFAVPAFFVLSGYLIGGILYHTRNREGFFRVFYLRRVLRVFPVFYITLLAIAAFFAVKGIPISSHFWAHFFYVQNLQLGQTYRSTRPVLMTHFWSLAVEEQFYLVWPLVVWRFREKRKLVGICVATILLCSLVRLAAPLLGIPVLDVSFHTLTRVDAVLLGVLLSLMNDSDLVRRVTPFAKWVSLVGCATMVTLGAMKGETWAMSTYPGKDTWITLANFTSLAIVMAVMEQGSLLNRLCSQKWICFIGALSYSLYVFHLLYWRFFVVDVSRYLGHHMRASFAYSGAIMLAFFTTVGLSLLSMRLIELPLMSLKKHIPYGAAKESNSKRPLSGSTEPALAERGA